MLMSYIILRALVLLQTLSYTKLLIVVHMNFYSNSAETECLIDFSASLLCLTLLFNDDALDY